MQILQIEHHRHSRSLHFRLILLFTIFLLCYPLMSVIVFASDHEKDKKTKDSSIEKIIDKCIYNPSLAETTKKKINEFVNLVEKYEVNLKWDVTPKENLLREVGLGTIKINRFCRKQITNEIVKKILEEYLELIKSNTERRETTIECENISKYKKMLLSTDVFLLSLSKSKEIFELCNDNEKVKKQRIQKRRQNCYSVDLRKNANFLESNRDQDKVSWCYACQISDLISYKYRSECTNNTFSPVDIAIQYNLKEIPSAKLSGDGANWGGIPADTIDIVCKNEKLLYDSDSTLNINTKNILPVLDEIYFNKKFNQNQLTKINELFPHINKNDLLTLFKNKNLFKATNPKSMLFMRRLLDINARKGKGAFKLTKDDLPYVCSYSNYNKIKFNMINDQLQKSNMVGIEILANLLTDHTQTPDKNSRHELSIIGRKFNEKSASCSYLLRDSFGNGRLNNELDPVYTPEGGNYWVDSEHLEKMLEMVIYLK
ncbi:MAG: hypothetical protein HQK49_22700 [Oligoflexia bacterium]|nr:hypothetical protein [Oligoflexia bacterium]